MKGIVKTKTGFRQKTAAEKLRDARKHTAKVAKINKHLKH